MCIEILTSLLNKCLENVRGLYHGRKKIFATVAAFMMCKQTDTLGILHHCQSASLSIGLPVHKDHLL